MRSLADASRSRPGPLEPSDGPEGALDGDLGTVTDEQWYLAQKEMPPLRPAARPDSSPVDPMDGAVWEPDGGGA